MKTKFIIGLIIFFAEFAIGQTVHDKNFSSDELIKVDLEFCKATKEKGLDGWMSYFAEDSFIFPNGLPVISGKSAIREVYIKINFDPTIISWKPEYAEVSQSGELGFTYGYADFTIKDSSGIKVYKGKYTTIWKKQPNGEWKVKVDFGNSAEPE
jgi:ketosteroid isomerase-like protein